MKSDTSAYFESILHHFRTQRARDRARHTLFLALALNLGYVLLAAVLESIWYFPPIVKQLFRWGLAFNALAAADLLRILWDVLSRHSAEENARLLLHIGRRVEAVRDKLLNHYQLSRSGQELAQLAVSRFTEQHPPAVFDGSYQPKPLKRKRNIVLIMAALCALCLPFLSGGMARLWHAKIPFEPMFPYSISAEPRDTTVFSYDSLKVRIVRRAPAHFPVELYSLQENTPLPELPAPSRDSLFNFSLDRVRGSRTYVVALRRPHLFYARKYIDTDTVRVTVIERPKIRTLEFTVAAPAYSGLPEARYEGNIDRFRMLRGSVLSIDALLSDTAGFSTVVLAGDTLPMTRDGARNRISVIPEKDGPIVLNIRDRRGVGIKEPPFYHIELEEDARPQLSILRPESGERILLRDAMKLPFMAYLQDDFGLSAFRVSYSVRSEYSADTARFTADLPLRSDARIQSLAGSWETGRFISPGSELSYYFELSDNDAVAGPKTVRSETFYAEFPTLGELFRAQSEEAQTLQETLENEILSGSDILQDIDKIRKELLQEGELDWENRSALQENLDALEQAQKELEEMQTSLQKQEQFMKENALFSESVMSTFEQLQELMNELIDDEMFDMMKSIRDKLERGDMSDMEKVLEDFSEKAKRFEESLERMLDIFKRIQQEQRLEEIAARLKETLEKQQDLLEQAGDMSGNDAAERQEQIAEETEDLEERIRESSGLFEEEAGEDFRSFREEMEASAVTEDMERASDAFRKPDREAGMSDSRAAEKKLGKLSASFDKMAGEMMEKQKEEITSRFYAILQKTLYMSQRQEEALEFGAGLENDSPLLHAFTSREGEILQLAQDISSRMLALSKKTFFVDKALGLALGGVLAELSSGIRNIEEANLSQGRDELRSAYKYMNRLGRLLLQRMEQTQQQQGNASGLEFYLQQLQQMAGQQQQLNDGMPQPGMNGSPGDSMMDQLARLAARQQALRRSLKEIGQGLSDSENGGRVTGDLERIAKDMEEIIDQMRRNQVNRQTLLRQEQIVQRLLDASRSATSRDFKEERESVTGSDLPRENPLGLPDDLGEHGSLINSLRRAVRESDLSAQEKRDMEAYLESLLRQNTLPRPESEEKK